MSLAASRGPRGGAGADRAASLLGSALAVDTKAGYDSKIKRFVKFCELGDAAGMEVSALPALTETVVRYIGWSADERTAGRGPAPTSFQGYLSAINTAHEMCQLSAPAVGRQVTDAMSGWTAEWEASEEGRGGDHRVPILADDVQRVVARGLTSHVVAEVRGDTALALGFVWFGRSKTVESIEERDVAITASHLRCYVRHEKTRRKAKKRVLAFPRSSPGIEALVQLIEHWRRLRGQVGGNQRLLQLPSETANTRYGPSVVSEWYVAALARVGASVGEGFSWSSHSARSGGASACHSIGISELTISALGGWVAGSEAIQRYVDFTIARSEGAMFFFAWLLSGAAFHERSGGVL
jgi:hypothetical protein